MLGNQKREKNSLDDKSLAMLEFPRVREILAGYTSFEASRRLALELKPLTDYKTITRLLRQSYEARSLLAVEPDFRIGEIDDIRESAELAARGGMLEQLALAKVARTLSLIRQAGSRLRRFADEFPSVWEVAEQIQDMRPLEKRIDACLTPDGELLDSASPELSSLRHQVRLRRQQLIASLEGILRSPRAEKIIQEPIVTEREGRYVIPVKVEARREIQGIVHDVSNTGATVFMEPWEAVEQGNELREIVNQEKRETEKILRELSGEVGAFANDIVGNVAVAAELDLIFAKADYARRNRASEPEIVLFEKDARPAVRLVNARHPLLGSKAVPLSIEIGKDFTVLVITGPNTGGKTVALKTIGLLSTMALAGIPIPASEESKIPVFDGIFVDIGDEQSIEQTLSTFSWHIGNISRFTHSVTEKSLVLLDELGTSTDPAEGSALARAILLHFLSKSTMTVATTHLGDLKAFAYVTGGLQNASLDIDPKTLAPTYHLTVGLPGGSNALATAARLGLEGTIVVRARELLASGTREVEDLITSLAEERDRNRLLNTQLEDENRKAAKLSGDLGKELQELRARERAVIQETRDKIVKESSELQRELRQAGAELRRQKSRETIEHTRKVLASLRERMKGEVWQLPSTSPTGTFEVAEEPVKPGDTVWLKEAGIEACVLTINEANNEIEVQSGHTKIKLGLEGVEKILSPDKGEARRFIPVVKPVKKAVPAELMLIGKRYEEAENLLKRYLDDASLAGLVQVRIVHGSGTGALRRMVRETISTHPLVKSYRAGERGEGGEGATILRLQ